MTTDSGGAWLLGETRSEDVFTPEDRTDEHRMISSTARAFVEQEVLPQVDALEAKQWDVTRALLRRCGALGLLGTDVPEELGGVGLDVTSSVLVSEAMGLQASFATTVGATMGLCVIPILWFGTDAQRRRYLPCLVSGEMVGAYALSEASSGSDALGARAVARIHPDGGYALDGEKMWITNAGFADLFVVFAKVNGEQFTAFLIERETPGLSTGREERKMGLHGSSTAPLLLQGVRVPDTAVLGEVGRGHKVAFTVLNYGRFKLGAMCVGGGRQALADAARYAAARKQFGEPIASFGAIRMKLSEMAARLYAAESVLYRLAGAVSHAADDGQGTKALALEQHAIEASIVKILASETLQYVLDENIQIHGGNGFVREYGAERSYRDARVNRIFEGTNEINRLLIAGQLIRRAVKGDVPLLAAARRLPGELLGAAVAAPNDPIESLAHGVRGLRKVTLLVLGAALQRFGEKVSEEQEVLLWIADLAIDAYASESAVLRASRYMASAAATLAGATGVGVTLAVALQRPASSVQPPASSVHLLAAQLTVHEAVLRAEAVLAHALPAVLEGDELRMALAGVRRLLRMPALDQRPLRRELAAACVERGGWSFGERSRQGMLAV